MVCIHCGQATTVINSRRLRRHNQTWRRRRCAACGTVFTSSEVADLGSALLVSSPDGLEPFTQEKLLFDITLALRGRQDRYMAARELTQRIITNLLANTSKPLLSTKQIAAEAAKVIGRFDKRAGQRYSVDHLSA